MCMEGPVSVLPGAALVVREVTAAPAGQLSCSCTALPAEPRAARSPQRCNAPQYPSGPRMCSGWLEVMRHAPFVTYT